MKKTQILLIPHADEASDFKLSVSTHTSSDVEQQDQKENKVTRLSFAQAIKQVGTFSMPFVLSRMVMSVNIIGNGVIFAKLGSTEAAAGALITTCNYAIINTMRSAIISTGIPIGDLNGEKTSAEKAGAVNVAQLKCVAIGNMVRKSWVLGAMLAVPTCGALLSTGTFLKALHISDPVADTVQEYLTTMTYVTLPIFWSTSDQQFALGIKRKNIPLVTGALYAGLSMLFGYPLALGVYSLPKMGVKGLGIGMAVSGWMSLIGLRIYFKLNKDFKPYGLFELNFQGVFDKFLDLLKLSLPFAFQTFTEWGNLAALSIMVGVLGKNESIAAQVSIQPISAFNLALLGLAQPVSVLISNTIGEMRDKIRQQDHESVQIYQANIKKFGNAGIAIGVSASVITCGFLVGFPKQITSFFNSEASAQDIEDLAQTWLFINAVGLIVDAFRNMASGALAGFKDVLFAPILSFITMSIIGLSGGGCLTFLLDGDADWLFSTRDIGILLATIGIAMRWMSKEYVEEKIQSQLADINSVDASAPQDDKQSAYQETSQPWAWCRFHKSANAQQVRHVNYQAMRQADIKELSSDTAIIPVSVPRSTSLSHS